LKYASFGRGVNVTLGLPFVRTSVDHGTALELAGTGKADPGSLIEATKLRSSSHRPRKRFGQHFLHDPRVLARLVESINPARDDVIVEIGPGEGALTRHLMKWVGHFEVIELDRDLASRLAAEFPPPRLTVHCADALEYDFS